jgi:hypothetical protein
VQCTLIAVTALVALLPPADGMILVAPLIPGRPAETIGWLLPTGALLAASGPYDGAFVVKGSRAALLPAAIANGAVLLATRFPGGGPGAENRN